MILKIKKMGINGEGIAYDRKIPVFVDGGLPGETADIHITEDHGTYKFGKINRLLVKNGHRIEPSCRLCGVCGGCPLMILDYPKQLAEKKKLVLESLEKYSGVHIENIDILENPSVLGYRNSCKLPLKSEKGSLTVGLFRKGSNAFLRIDNCPIHEDALNRYIRKVLTVLNRHNRSAFSRKSREGLRYLCLRTFAGRCECCIVTGKDKLPEALIEDLMKIEGMDVLAVSVNADPKSREIFGREIFYCSSQKYLIFPWHGLELEISPRAFFQLNTEQGYRLFEKAVSMIGDHKKHIMEAYCGVGIISMLIHDKAERITAFDLNEDAVLDARRIAERNGISNIDFYCSDAGRMLKRNNDCDLLIVDPPRSGLDDTMIREINCSDIPEILYISCSHTSFAKNLHDLSNYALCRIEAVDMFSNTPLTETVALLNRK